MAASDPQPDNRNATAPFDGQQEDSSSAHVETLNLPERIGRYRVQSILGKGGFGVVYLAHDDQLNRPVAVKVPHTDLVVRPENAELYLAEARAVAALDHPGIVPVYDVGCTDQIPCYIVSKFIDGTNLATKLTQSRPAFVEAAELVATVAEAIHYAHKQGLVHRDIKPGNILIDSAGRPFVVDFGLALREQDAVKRATYAGTPAYMSPEQARGEGHRVDGRSDIFSLGVVLYELLVGHRPFHAESVRDLFDLIETQEAKPPRQIDDRIPKELERICLKAISKRATERHTTASDLADDLRHFLTGVEQLNRLTVERPVPRDVPVQTVQPLNGSTVQPAPAVTPPDSDQRVVRIVPKGLRSFDAHDADFFLELLPGPRDRDGLPDSIRFWKGRIEDSDADNTFSVGLIYGPSGCGKSSLVKAGLLPRLAPRTLAVYVEATANETESRLLAGLHKRCPALSGSLSLKDSLAELRRGRGMGVGQKVLIVLDQFEQWLHARRTERDTELVRALRQCDGSRVQAIVMVRDDFWLAVSRFLADLEIDLVQGQNCALVDLFDPRHATKVLTAFGCAFTALPEDRGQLSAAQTQFLSDAVDGLAEDGKVISVRLALFAEMVKGKPWTPETLREVGGTAGVGVTFLEETFSATTANPKHRLHQQAARGVLRALLPEQGTDIKGNMRTRDELVAASGYRERPREFDELLRILDGELRLVTPTDPEALECGGLTPLSFSRDSLRADTMSEQAQTAEPAEKRRQAAALQSFQLTHDYLVPSLREWLTRKQRETWRGRAELRLEERTAQWSRTRESRFLPNPMEFAAIATAVPRRKRTPDQRRLMRAAGRRYGVIAALVLVAASLLGWAGWETSGRLRADGLVRAVKNASIDQVPALTAQLQPYRRWAEADLRNMRADDSDSDSQLHAALALVAADATQAAFLTERMLDCRIEQLPVIRDVLHESAGAELGAVRAKLWATLGVAGVESSSPQPFSDRPGIEAGGSKTRPQPPDSARRFNAALALATFDSDAAGWSAETVNFVVGQLLASSVDFQARYRAALEPIRLRLVDAVRAAGSDATRDATQRILATNALVDFGRDQPDALVRALVVASGRQYPILLDAVRPHREPALAELTRQLVARPERVWPQEIDVSRFAEPARALVVKIENAGGLVEPHFAFCQSLPLAEFADVNESLRSFGYRPTRVRPYSGEPGGVSARSDGPAPRDHTTPGADATRLAKSLLCAAVWQRDGRDWQFRAGQAADSVAAADQEMADKGLEPVDVAGYLDGGELRHVVLWGVPDAHTSPQREQGFSLARRATVPPERPTIEVGLTRQEFETKAKGDLTPVVLQLTTPADDATPRVAVIWRKKRPDDTWAIGDEAILTQNAATNAGRPALDIAVFRAEPPDGKRAGAAEQIERLTAQLAQKPDDPALLRARGLAAVNLGRDEQAVEDLTKFLEKAPGSVLDRHFLAVAQARLGRKEAATQTLEEVTKRAGDTSQGAYSRAVVGAILGTESEALAALEEAIKAHAGDSGFLYDAACAYALVAEHLATVPAVASRLFNAEGVSQHSPGSRVRERTLGQRGDDTNYPEGVTHPGDAPLCNPFGVSDSIVLATQGALADSRPWAAMCNPFGVIALISPDPDPDRAERIAKYKARAIELLVLACDAGYSDGEHLRTDSDLESLWAEAGFRGVLARLGADRRYAAVWAGAAIAAADAQSASVAAGAEPSSTATDKSVTALVDSVESHGLDAQAHLARCRELVEAGYRLQSLVVLPRHRPRGLLI